MDTALDYPNWNLIPQAPSSYYIHVTCQIENLGWLLEQLPNPFGIFDPNRKGRIVEVGAFDGKTYSNSYGLTVAGWPTVLVEPMFENLVKCHAEHLERPWVNIVPVACGSDSHLTQMFFEREGSRLAKTEEELKQRRIIPVASLDSVLEELNWTPDFDLFVSDTEDMELEVLDGFDLTYWQPKLVIVETHGPIRERIHKIFKPLYSTFFEDGLNTIFARRDWFPG